MQKVIDKWNHIYNQSDHVQYPPATVLKDNTPDPFVVSACPFVPSVAGKVKKTPVFNFVELCGDHEK